MFCNSYICIRNYHFYISSDGEHALLNRDPITKLFYFTIISIYHFYFELILIWFSRENMHYYLEILSQNYSILVRMNIWVFTQVLWLTLYVELKEKSLSVARKWTRYPPLRAKVRKWHLLYTKRSGVTSHFQPTYEPYSIWRVMLSIWTWQIKLTP